MNDAPLTPEERCFVEVYVYEVAPEGLTISFDINRAKATLERERDLGRPLQEILASYEAREE